jgi:hypothetical protein
VLQIPPLRQAAKRWQKILTSFRVKRNFSKTERTKILLLMVGKAETATKNNLKVGNFKFTL